MLMHALCWVVELSDADKVDALKGGFLRSAHQCQSIILEQNVQVAQVLRITIRASWWLFLITSVGIILIPPPSSSHAWQLLMTPGRAVGLLRLS
jgi:hypothetical protein